MADVRSYITGFDLDTGAGTEYNQGISVRISDAGGSIEAKGQQLMAASLPVALASNQSAVAVDTELPAAGALTDNMANPTTPLVGACMMVWDGATWDRAPGTTAAGITVDTELPAAAALADGAGNPTTPLVGACNMIWNGATWDRAPGATATGLLVNTELPTAAALADAAGNPTTPLVGACLLGYNGATWDRIYAVADGAAVAAGTKGFVILGTDGANYQVILTDSTGKISVDIGTPSAPVTDYQTSAAVAAGATAVLTTAEAAAKKLTGVEVWASVACKVTVHTVDNGVESAILVIGGFQAFVGWQYKTPHRNYIVLGTTAGVDAFRVNVTNLDDANAADIYATFHYES